MVAASRIEIGYKNTEARPVPKSERQDTFCLNPLCSSGFSTSSTRVIVIVTML